MTWRILYNHTSVLESGIETITIPLTEQREIDAVMLNVQRGGIHGLAEWVLTELFRQMEIDRVISVRVHENSVIMLMKQPGKQIEKWMAERQGMYSFKLSHLAGGSYWVSAKSIINGEAEKLGTLSATSLDPTPFRKHNPPYWRQA